MGHKKNVERSYPPALVSAETLAYLLDCSRSTVDDYVTRRLLPKPVEVGTLKRWWWCDVEASIHAQNTLASAPAGDPPLEDPFLLGVKNVASAHA
jgi:predicted DNA-binding transcriptional regulator AlpA